MEADQRISDAEAEADRQITAAHEDARRHVADAESRAAEKVRTAQRNQMTIASAAVVQEKLPTVTLYPKLQSFTT